MALLCFIIGFAFGLTENPVSLPMILLGYFYIYVEIKLKD